MVLTEIVDEQCRPTSGVGEVVGTELHNHAMPFVRYRQGDLARISDATCKCGRHTRLLTDLVGRRNDGFLLRDGSRLSAGFLLDVSYRAILGLEENIVSAYRFVQKDPDRAVFEVVAGTAWGENSEASIKAALASELPAALAVSVAVVPEISKSAGGKRSTVVREFAQ